MIELYDNLMALVKNSTKSKFFFKDFQSALGVNYLYITAWDNRLY